VKKDPREWDNQEFLKGGSHKDRGGETGGCKEPGGKTGGSQVVDLRKYKKKKKQEAVGEEKKS